MFAYVTFVIKYTNIALKNKRNRLYTLLAIDGQIYTI